MRANLLQVLHEVKASYWFIPSCLVILATLLASMVRWLGSQESLAWIHTLHWFGQVDPAGARAMLTTIAGSVIGVAGVTFSITIVAVSFASANFGPRLIGNFMTDRGSQLTLGTFIGTFVYCLVVLPAIPESAIEQGVQVAGVPTAATPVALVLMFVSVAMFIYFVHHAAEKINIENIVADIGRKLTSDMHQLFPYGVDLPERTVDERTQELPVTADVCIQARAGGYVQVLALAQLVDLAERLNVDIRLHYRPGDFVVPGDILMSVYGVAAMNDDDRAACCDSLAMGNQRTEPQNVLFCFEQLLEVIARALSPGVNDPYTAITCFNWMKSPLASLLKGSPGGGGLVQVGRVRMTSVNAVTVLDTVFGGSLDYVCSDSMVSLHVMSLLAELGAITNSEIHRDNLSTHLSNLYEAAQSHHNERATSERLTRRYEAALGIIDGRSSVAQLRSEAAWFGGSA